MKTIEQINTDYNKKYINAEVFFDDEIGYMEIYHNGRESLNFANLDNIEAVEVAEYLLKNFDFSYFLEFHSIKEFNEYFDTNI